MKITSNELFDNLNDHFVNIIETTDWVIFFLNLKYFQHKFGDEKTAGIALVQ